MDAGNTFLHDAFDILEQAWVLLMDPVGQIAAIIQYLRGGGNKLFINAFVVVKGPFDPTVKTHSCKSLHCV